jgi:hypothetical protein
MASSMTKRFTVGLLAFSFASGAVFASWTAQAGDRMLRPAAQNPS